MGWKMDICVPEVVSVGHHCTYKGCYPEDRKVQKIIDWPDCNTLLNAGLGGLEALGLDALGVWTVASACALHLPTKSVQTFRIEPNFGLQG